MNQGQWPRSRAAWERAQRSLSGGVATGLRASTRPHPIFFEGGAGAHMTDLDGREYIDYVLGWGPNILGHANERLVDAVSAQIRRGATYGSGHRAEYEVAERLLGIFPGMERMLWSNTGTEADLVALRLARAFTGHTRFIKLAGHYHGWSDSFLVGYRSRDDGTQYRESLGQPASSLSEATVLPWGDLNAVAVALEEDPAVAAIFLEPVLCNSGVISPPPGYLEGLRELCDRYGCLLVFDEVITGLRIAPGGASERYGIVPDMVILAKAIAGGLSLAAVLGKSQVIDQTQHGVVHAGTYNGNPLVLAAAAATLDELLKPGQFEELESMGRQLAQGFASVLESSAHTFAVNQVGPIVQCCLGVERLEDLDDFLQADQALYDKLLVELLKRGVFALPGGRWYLSTAHTPELVTETVAIFSEAVQAVG